MFKLNLNKIFLLILFVSIILTTPANAAPQRNVLTEKETAVKRCREKCTIKLIKYLSDTDKKTNQCGNNADCQMCWDYCHAVVVAQKTLANSMCGDNVFCTAGCQTACKYHKIKTKNKILDSITLNEV